MIDRAALVDRFVAAAGWGAAARHFLAGDASPRRYQRLSLGDRRAVLMDAPPGVAEDTRPFVQIAGHLRGLGLSAPEILAQDHDNGLLLLEDLGDNLHARHLERAPQDEGRLYAAAVDVLAVLQRAPPPADIPAHSHTFMAEAAGMAPRWYARAITGRDHDPAPLVAAMAAALAAHCTAPPVLVLRDYHAENLLWLPERAGVARVGLLDFQMGSRGQPEYDLISLLQDARRDVAPDLLVPMVTRLARATGRDPDAALTAATVLGAQRALRVLGAFARLSLHFGKPGYVRLIPRVWAHLQADLRHPALAGVAAVTADLPPPTPAALQRMIDLCGTVPTP